MFWASVAMDQLKELQRLALVNKITTGADLLGAPQCSLRMSSATALGQHRVLFGLKALVTAVCYR